MTGVKYRVEGSKLVIEADLSGSAGTTAKGHTMAATSGNWQGIPELGKGWSFNVVVVRNKNADPLPAERMKLVG